MQTPLNKSKTDAMFLRILANEFHAFQDAIKEVTDGRFFFTPEALKVIADKIERNGYADDAQEHDAGLEEMRERVYGETLAHERAKALDE